MRAAQTIQCEVRTKAGEITCVVNVVATGNDDGAVSVMRDVAAHVMRAGRFGGAAVASPPVRLQESLQDFVEQVDRDIAVGVVCPNCGALKPPDEFCACVGDDFCVRVADDDGMRRDSRE